MSAPSPEVLVFDSLDALSRAAAERLNALGAAACAARGRFVIALSGGGTPQTLYQLLATTPYANPAVWERADYFWGDERCVPPTDAGSSFRLAHEAFLRHYSIHPGRIHRARGEWEPGRAADDYAAQLRALGEGALAWPRFDAALLGLGDDGHTASLFPGPISQAERTQPVIAVTANYQGRPARRITLTPMVFNTARHVIFLVAGASKAQALAAVLRPPTDAERWPAARIQPTPGQVTWLVDDAAAKHIRP
jgi:6-phosphogluconolactonase